MNSRNPWLRLWPVWTPPALLLILNVVWLVGLRGALLGQGSLLSRRVADLEHDVVQLEAQRLELERSNRALKDLRVNLEALRTHELATMRERLLPFVTDVVVRAQEAGLRVERVSYAAKRDEKSGLVYFTASYGVLGGYDQIRRCVYLLESSPQFVVLDGLALRTDDPTASVGVAVQLTTGTYFADMDRDLMQKLGVAEEKSGEQG